MIPLDAARRIKSEAYRIGFDLCGVTNRCEPLHQDYLEKWFSEKRFGSMEWIPKHRNFRFHPDRLMAKTKSVIVVAVSYSHDPDQTEYQTARYAFGRDYHLWMREKLNQLAEFIDANIQRGFIQKNFVDTGPVLERDLASQAGLGWIGKNTCLINQSLGSYLFLGVMLTDLVLPEESLAKDACLNCRLCLDACPTGALEPYQLDPVKCLAYHNIEKRGERERSYWEKLGDHLVGCDICQEICPWNNSAPESRQKEWRAEFKEFELGSLKEILNLNDVSFRSKTKNSAISRIKYFDFMRNVFIVIANSKRRDLLSCVLEWKDKNPEADLSEWRWCVDVLSKGEK